MNIWAGEFGNEYTRRNPVTLQAIKQRERLWSNILNPMLPEWPRSVMEVGANVGINLRALRGHLMSARFFAVEPNYLGRLALISDNVVDEGDVYSGVGDATGAVDLIFTSGVLIHIPPAELREFCQKIYDHAGRWIVAIEYFSHEPQEVMYRGEMGRLWKRDFGAFYLDNFPDLMPISCGFAWSRTTGLDDLHWWAFEKR